MNRREILKSLVAIPFIGPQLAKTQASPLPPTGAAEALCACADASPKYSTYLITDKGQKILSGTPIQKGIHRITHFIVHDVKTKKVMGWGQVDREVVLCPHDVGHLDITWDITE